MDDGKHMLADQAHRMLGDRGRRAAEVDQQAAVERKAERLAALAQLVEDFGGRWAMCAVSSVSFA
jgi:hypothetical protein